MSGAVLMTGASSFTGLWIAEALAEAGYTVIAPLRRPRTDYAGVRLERVLRLSRSAEVIHDCALASSALSDIIRTRNVSALVHHAADVEGYREPGFDAAAAFARNAEGALTAFRLLAERGARAVLATGSVFEAGEGGGGPDSPAITPYGLSKTLSNIAFGHFADWAGLRFGKLVIASPYGVFEERRFGWHLFRSWFAGETPLVKTPGYVRDHAPAPLLARAYAAYLAELLEEAPAPRVHRPSGWIASQGAFAALTASEAAARLGRDCPIALNEGHAFEEPEVRVNADPIPREGWDEAANWDDYVGWYAELNAQGALT
jgi:UDP-glucose 4-epimerase